ncbi:MAG TPA: UbiA family prenyltransferase [Patescibacteria group bacterium]
MKNIFISLRPNVWARIFAEMLFGAALVHNALINIPIFLFGFLIIGPLIGGSSYLLNDITDYNYDKSHPLRKNRPIPSGKLSINFAIFVVLLLFLLALITSLFLSLNIFILSTMLIVSEFLYTAKPFRFKEIAIIDVLLNVFNTILRFLIGFILVGGSLVQLPIFLLGFTALIKLLFFFGHRWQNRKQEIEYKYRSSVVLLSKRVAVWIFCLLVTGIAILYIMSVFSYSLPKLTLFYPLFSALLLFPLIKSIHKGFLQTQEQNESLRNRLYIIFLLFSLAFFATAQVGYII